MNRHFEYVESYPQRFLALARAGRADPEIQAMIERGRQNALADILGILELVDPSPKLRAAIRGWVGYVHEITLHWLADRQGLATDDLAELCLNTLVQNLRTDGDPRREIRSGLRHLQPSESRGNEVRTKQSAAG
jgi:hypothetical protein